MQGTPKGHLFPHLPQFKGLKLVFLHSPVQHCHVNGHLILQNPQLLISEVTSTQTFLQHFLFGGHSPWLHIHGCFQQPGYRGLFISLSHGDEGEPAMVSFPRNSLLACGFESTSTSSTNNRSWSSNKMVIWALASIFLRCTRRLKGPFHCI